jgi:hypothetical protein
MGEGWKHSAVDGPATIRQHFDINHLMLLLIAEYTA